MTALHRFAVAAFVVVALVAGCDSPARLEPLRRIPFDEMGPRAAEHLRAEVARLRPLAEDPDLQDADRAAAFVELGRLLQAYSLNAGAVIAYRNAQALDPPDSSSSYLLAVALIDQGHSQDASEVLHGLLATDPDHSGARLRLAQIELEAGEIEEARTLYSAAVAAEDRDAAAHAGLGKAELAAGGYRLAVESLSRALELQPRADSLHRLLAQAHARLGTDDLAESHRRLAGDVDVAIADADLAAVQALAVGTGSALRRGDAAMLAGDFPRAEAAYRQAAEWSPDDASIHHSLAAARFRLGDLAGALESYRRSAELDPSNAAVRFNIGVTEMRLGRAEQAVAEFRQAVSLDDRPEYRIGLAEALLLSDETAAAERELLQVLAADPRSTTAQAMLARLVLSRGPSPAEAVRAVELATEAVRVRPTVEHVQLLAAAYAAAGRFDLATSWQRQLLGRVGPDADPAWLRRAQQDLAFYRAKQSPATPGQAR